MQQQEARASVSLLSTCSLPLLRLRLQTATLTNDGKDDAHPIKAMKFSVSPVVRVAVEPKVGWQPQRRATSRGILHASAAQLRSFLKSLQRMTHGPSFMQIAVLTAHSRAV
jgi:hypothetical protein